MAQAAQFSVKLLTDLSDFSAGLDRAVGQIEAFGARVGKIGSGLSSAGATMSANVTAPLMAAGAAAIAAATDIQGAMATIRVGTGATGEQLQALRGDFEAVFRAVPDGAATVATAIADYNTLLGATSEQLQTLSKAAVDVARMVGTDVGSVVASTSALFNDWQVATDKQAETMDLLWKASQASGVAFTDLSRMVAENGTVLRALNWDLEGSVAMLAQMNVAGVDASTVLSGFQRAIAAAGKAGKDAGDFLHDTFLEIERLGAGAKATALATSIFGRAAGPELVKMITEGRLSVWEFMEMLRASDETISKAADASKTFGQKFKESLKDAQLGLAAFGDTLIEVWEQHGVPLLERALGKFREMVDAFKAMTPEQQQQILMWVGIAMAAGPVLMVLGKIVGLISGLIGLFAGLVKAGGFIVGAFKTIALFAAGGAVSVGAVAGACVVAAAAVVGLIAILWKFRDEIGAVIKAAWDFQVGLVKAVVGAIADVGAKVGEWGGEVLGLFIDALGAVARFVSGRWLLDAFVRLFSSVFSWLGSAARRVFDLGSNIGRALLRGVLGVIRSIPGAGLVVNTIERALGGANAARAAADAGQRAGAAFARSFEAASAALSMAQPRLALAGAPGIVPAAAARQPAVHYHTNIAPGAIVVEGSGDADAVADRVVARLQRKARGTVGVNAPWTAGV